MSVLRSDLPGIPSARSSAITVSNRADLSLPDLPLHTIRPSRSWVPLNLRELWAYRELFFFLTWRDIKVRYRQTILGAFWAILQPLGTVLVFTVVFGKLARVPSEGIPYELFAYAAMAPWIFFANTVASAGNSLVYSADLITKVYFPRLIVPVSAVGLGLVDFLVSFAFFVVLLFWYGQGVGVQVLLLPVLIALTALLAVGCGIILAALNVKYRDVGHATPFLLQLGMFATPIIYPTSAIPAHWHWLQWLMTLNPMAGIVEGYRAALFVGYPFNGTALASSALITLLVLVGSAYLFRHLEKSFADLV
jgi:lipopolysaccharide transport system permease protein